MSAVNCQKCYHATKTAFNETKQKTDDFTAKIFYGDIKM